VRQAGLEELLADDLEAQALVECGGMHLCGELLLAQIAVLRLGDGGLHQCVTHLEPAPVLEHRHAPDLAILQQAGGADGVVTLKGQEVHGDVVVGIPLQLWRHVLLGNEHRFADTADVGVVFLPIGQAYFDLIHWQIPGFLA